MGKKSKRRTGKRSQKILEENASARDTGKNVLDSTYVFFMQSSSIVWLTSFNLLFSLN